MLNFILFKDFCGLHITIQKGVFFTEYKGLLRLPPLYYIVRCVTVRTLNTVINRNNLIILAVFYPCV